VARALSSQEKEEITASTRPAIELARLYEVSERTIFRIWKKAERPGQMSRERQKKLG
jgi:hypothetical protein